MNRLLCLLDLSRGLIRAQAMTMTRYSKTRPGGRLLSRLALGSETVIEITYRRREIRDWFSFCCLCSNTNFRKSLQINGLSSSVSISTHHHCCTHITHNNINTAAATTASNKSNGNNGSPKTKPSYPYPKRRQFRRRKWCILGCIGIVHITYIKRFCTTTGS